jgi:hypothetical protein
MNPTQHAVVQPNLFPEVNYCLSMGTVNAVRAVK